MDEIDHEIHDLLENAHTEAWTIINENRDILDELVRQLLVKETLNEKELAAIFANVKKADERPVWLSNAHRTLSDRPPVPIPESLIKSLRSSAEAEAEGTDASDTSATPAAPDAAGEAATGASASESATGSTDVEGDGANGSAA